VAKQSSSDRPVFFSLLFTVPTKIGRFGVIEKVRTALCRRPMVGHERQHERKRCVRQADHDSDEKSGYIPARGIPTNQANNKIMELAKYGRACIVRVVVWACPGKNHPKVVSRWFCDRCYVPEFGYAAMLIPID
jgi:hypothetical protein